MDESLVLAEKPRRDVHWIFWGSDGLRAGWSVLLFVLVFIVFEVLFGFVLGTFHLHSPHGSPVKPSFALIAEVAQVLMVLCSTGVMSRVERRPEKVYGYAGRARLVRFIWGVLLGFVAISALVGVLWKSHLLVFDGTTLAGTAVWKFAALWGIIFLLTGLFEESLLRGYLQYTLARGIGFWWGALLLSALFGFMHKSNAGESPVGLFSAAGIGLVFCISLWYTGSLWWAIGFHAAWDWGESYFYGTADSGEVVQGHLFATHPTGTLLWSGGLTGPEGSLLIVPFILLIALGMWLWWRRKGTPEWQLRISTHETPAQVASNGE